MKKHDIPRVKAGDLVAYSGRYWLSAFINVVTGGIPLWSTSHVGIVAKCSDHRLRVFESTTLEGGEKCELTNKVVEGVQAHSLERMVELYDGRIWVYPVYRILYPYEEKRLTKFLMGALGRPYDVPGAIRAGGFINSWVQSLLHDQDLNKLFCSELVAAAYSETGLIPTDNASRWSPNKLVRHLRKHEVVLKPKRIK